MAKEMLSQGGSARAWTDKDHFKGRFLGLANVTAGRKRFLVVRFADAAGQQIEKNATTKWEELASGKSPVIKKGDWLEVRAMKEQGTARKGQRFRPFEIVRLTGTDIPKQSKS